MRNRNYEYIKLVHFKSNHLATNILFYFYLFIYLFIYNIWWEWWSLLGLAPFVHVGEEVTVHNTGTGTQLMSNKLHEKKANITKKLIDDFQKSLSGNSPLFG